MFGNADAQFRVRHPDNGGGVVVADFLCLRKTRDLTGFLMQVKRYREFAKPMKHGAYLNFPGIADTEFARRFGR